MAKHDLQDLRARLAALRGSALAALAAAETVDLGSLQLLVNTGAAIKLVDEEIAATEDEKELE